jgi:hypothetical protein
MNVDQFSQNCIKHARPTLIKCLRESKKKIDEMTVEDDIEPEDYTQRLESVCIAQTHVNNNELNPLHKATSYHIMKNLNSVSKI